MTLNIHLRRLVTGSGIAIKLTESYDAGIIRSTCFLKFSIFSYLDTKSVKLAVLYVPINRITPQSSIVKIVEILNYYPALRARKVEFVSVFTVPSEMVIDLQLTVTEGGV
jgi:hypothetical protein